MAKVAIVTDSNSGITQKASKELGVTVLPMPFMINEETFFEDIDLNQEQFSASAAASKTDCRWVTEIRWLLTT